MEDSVFPEGRRFLDEVATELAKRWETLKCNDIHLMYSQFFNDLKEYRGNSEGFQGLSEYLILRFVLCQLGGNFRPETDKGWENRRRFMRGDGKIEVRSCDKRRPVGGNLPFSPDITIYRDGELAAVVEVKTFAVQGRRTVPSVFQAFRGIRKQVRGWRGLAIIFWGRTIGRGQIQSGRARKRKFNCLWLRDNGRFLKDELDEYLGLTELAGVVRSGLS